MDVRQPPRLAWLDCSLGLLAVLPLLPSSPAFCRHLSADRLSEWGRTVLLCSPSFGFVLHLFQSADSVEHLSGLRVPCRISLSFGDRVVRPFNQLHYFRFLFAYVVVCCLLDRCHSLTPPIQGHDSLVSSCYFSYFNCSCDCNQNVSSFMSRLVLWNKLTWNQVF